MRQVIARKWVNFAIRFLLFLFQFKLDQIVVWSLQPSLYNWLNIKFIWKINWRIMTFGTWSFLQIHIFDTKTVFIWHCSGHYRNSPYYFVPLYVRISIYMGFCDTEIYGLSIPIIQRNKTLIFICVFVRKRHSQSKWIFMNFF